MEAASDDPPNTGGSVVPKQQFGISTGLYQGLYKTITLAFEYFRAQTTWQDHGQMVTGGTNIIRPVQTVNFVNVGATLAW